MVTTQWVLHNVVFVVSFKSKHICEAWCIFLPHKSESIISPMHVHSDVSSTVYSGCFLPDDLSCDFLNVSESQKGQARHSGKTEVVVEFLHYFKWSSNLCSKYVKNVKVFCSLSLIISFGVIGHGWNLYFSSTKVRGMHSAILYTFTRKFIGA